MVGEEGLPEKYRNNLVNSVIHSHGEMGEQKSQEKKGMRESKLKNSKFEESVTNQFRNYSQVRTKDNAKNDKNIHEISEITKSF